MPGVKSSSPLGRVAILAREGIVPARYRDQVGVYTFGGGHTAAAGAPDPAKLSPIYPIGQALDAMILAAAWLFVHDLAKYEMEIDAAIHVPLTQGQRDALLSWHYNTGRIGNSTLTDKVNREEWDSAAYEFARWVHPVSLIQRRREEAAMFRGQAYPRNAVNVWMTDGADRVLWKSARTIPVDQAAQLLARAASLPAAPAFRYE